MPVYNRTTPIHAIEFLEKEFLENPLLYPDVFDKAMFSELWFGKTAKDGRYYIQVQPNTMIGVGESTTVNEGDYIIREGLGVVYIMPKKVFEEKHKIVSEDVL